MFELCHKLICGHVLHRAVHQILFTCLCPVWFPLSHVSGLQNRTSQMSSKNRTVLQIDPSLLQDKLVFQ